MNATFKATGSAAGALEIPGDGVLAGAGASHAVSTMTSAATRDALRIVCISSRVSAARSGGLGAMSVSTSLYGSSYRAEVSSLHSHREVEAVQRLFEAGWNNCQISRSTGIPLSTIWNWRHGLTPSHSRTGIGKLPSECPRCDGVPLDEAAYSYLLGLYLGDGHIVVGPRTSRLSIYQDARYPHLVSLAGTAIDRVLPLGNKPFKVARDGCMEVCGYWLHWTCVFPQHGPGVKHRRTIRLEQWQQQIVGRYPRQLLRGLIHSDGCRVINRVQKRKYAYPRYFFTNASADILQLFRDACDDIGVQHRNTRPRVISVARRGDVAAFDTFIGPKS